MVANPTQAAEIMHRDVPSVSPDLLLSDVRHTLFETNHRSVPVVAGGRLVGIISRTDLGRVEELMASLDAEVSDAVEWADQEADGFEHPAPHPFAGFEDRTKCLRVRDAMRRQVITCAPSAPLAQVADEMVRHHVNQIVVVEKESPVGMVNSLDLVKLFHDLLVAK
jgi:CBS domain-containing protein